VRRGKKLEISRFLYVQVLRNSSSVTGKSASCGKVGVEGEENYSGRSKKRRRQSCYRQQKPSRSRGNVLHALSDERKKKSKHKNGLAK